MKQNLSYTILELTHIQMGFLMVLGEFFDRTVDPLLIADDMQKICASINFIKDISRLQIGIFEKQELNNPQSNTPDHENQGTQAA